MYGEWLYRWGKKTEERRLKGGVSYSLQGQTWHVLTPAWLSRSLLWLNTLSIGSGTCMPSECLGGIRSSPLHPLLCILLDLVMELGSSDHGWHFHGTV